MDFFGFTVKEIVPMGLTAPGLLVFWFSVICLFASPAAPHLTL